LENIVNSPSPVLWLIRISEVFADSESMILQSLAAERVKKLGKEFHLVRLAKPDQLHHSEAARFVRWNLPVHHSWPCCPQETPGFIEKAAQALCRKFAAAGPQALIVGPLDAGSSGGYYRTLASNLRGRALQLFPPQVAAIRDAEAQDSKAPTLFCLIGREGLFCGLQSPQQSNGFYPGGTKFIPQNAAGTISRAGAKIAEALHYLQLERPLPAAGSHWLELGASPGGMTSELLGRAYRVTAVDRAPLDKRLDNAAGLVSVLADAATFRPARGIVFDAILSDMNGDARESISQVVRLSRFLKPGGLVVFTMKTPGVTSVEEIDTLERSVLEISAAGDLRVFARTHLTYNRHEFTLFFERGGASGSGGNGV
jgi:23S rRNA (cytidine2498-2'-O)-methyltransferase